jgi:hypothetical protein
MYIHIGEERDAISSDIIGVFDIEKITQSTFTREFLEEATKDETSEIGSVNLPRSLVIMAGARAPKSFGEKRGGAKNFKEKKITLVPSVVNPATIAGRDSFNC